MKQRIVWIDLCKGFAIILVLLGHSYSTNNGMLVWLNSFHMPLFFALSGLLFSLRRVYDRPLKRVLWDNFRALLIPYFIYSILLTIFIQLLRTHGGSDYFGAFINELKYVFLLYGNSPMWFLPCLFLAEIVLVLLHRLPTYVRLVAVFVGLIIGVWLPQDAILLALICRVLRAVFFITIGELLGKIDLEKKGFLFIPLLAGHFFICQWNANETDFWKNKIIFILCALLGSIGMILFFAGYMKKARLKMLEYYGKNTLTILCTHPFIIELIRLADYKLMGNWIKGLGAIEGIIITLIVLLIEIPLIWIIVRYAPILAGKKKCRSGTNNGILNERDATTDK